LSGLKVLSSVGADAKVAKSKRLIDYETLLLGIGLCRFDLTTQRGTVGLSWIGEAEIAIGDVHLERIPPKTAVLIATLEIA
jgi:hypothetical protein